MDRKIRIEKIYSRNKIKIPKIKYCLIKDSNKKENNRKKIIIKIVATLLLIITILEIMFKAVEPTVDKQCINIARSIATRISNEQATKVMEKYSYEDLTNITKDEEGNISMISANIVNVNKIISDIPILIQEELNKADNNKFYIKLGTFTGNKLLAGRGPDVEIKMASIGNISTDLKSEFNSSGINQTIHRIYLEIRCNVTILTPFNNIEEQIVNQVLLAEGIIIGNIPNTYYNIDGLSKDNVLDIME